MIPFSHRTNDELRFGEDSDGRMVPIEKVTQTGLACGLVCPSKACGRRLIAYLNVRKKRPYLGHEPGSDCQYAGESALHKYAKQLIQDRGTLRLPKVVLGTKTLHPEHHLKFDSVVLENRFHTIIPDIIATVGKHKLLIEIHVTHACDERKQAVLADKALSTVEIDLSDLHHGTQLQDLDDAIIDTASRKWIYNHRIPKELERLRLAQEQKDIADAAALADQLQTLRGRPVPTAGQLSAEEKYVREHDLTRLCSIVLRGSWVTGTTPARWQAFVLKKILDNWLYDDAEYLSAEDLASYLGDLPGLLPGLAKLAPAVVEKVRIEVPEFVSLRQLAASYRAALIQRGFLEKDGRVSRTAVEHANAAYRKHRQAEADRLAEKKRQALEEQQKREARERERLRIQKRNDDRRTVEAAVAALLESVPDEARAGFSIQRWWTTPLANGRRPESCLEYGSWELTDKLKALASVFEKGSPPLSNLMNLPLESFQREREAEVKAARLAAEQEFYDKRLQKVKAWALRRDKDPDWIDSPQVTLQGLSPRDATRGPESVWQTLSQHEGKKDQLAREARQQAEEERQRAEPFVNQLVKAAEYVYGDKIALWMDRTNNRLGASPRSRCRDQRSFELCIDALEADSRKKIPARLQDV